VNNATRRHVWTPKGAEVQTCPQCGMVRRWKYQGDTGTYWFYFRNARTRKPFTEPIVEDQWPYDACTGERIQEAPHA